MVWVFISCLGLFNSTKLEERYVEGSNQELIFQNGIIISSAFIGLFLAAFFVELLIMKKRPVSSVPSGKTNKKKVDTKKLDKTEKDSTKDAGLAIEKEKDVKSD